MRSLENARRAPRGAPRRPLRRLVWGGALLLAGLGIAANLGSIIRAEEPVLHRLAVLPFEIEDRSGEAGASNRYDAKLATITRVVAEKIAADKLYDVIAADRVDAAVDAANPGTYLRQCNGCERDIARSVGADRVMIGWIFKMSSLVLSLHVVVKDVATGKILYARVFDFRGDNERSWKRAADNMVRSLDRRI